MEEPFALEFQSPQSIDPTVSLESSNIEFVERLCAHIQQLCLTKTSLQSISHLAATYRERLGLNHSYKALFTQFFQEVLSFCNQIILRLKKLDSKKFQPLIKRKLTDIFGCVMRYSYDLKMVAMADKANQMKRMVKINTSYYSLNLLMLYHDNVRQAFLKIKKAGISEHRFRRERLINKLENALWKMNYTLKLKQLQEQRMALYNWHLQVKGNNILTNTLVIDKARELFVRLCARMHNPSQTHQAVLESLKQFCRTERIQFFRYSNSHLINYHQSQVQLLSSERSSIEGCTRELPSELYKESIESQEMVTESLNHSTSRLYIPLQYTSTIGLIVMTYQNSALDWKEIECLLNYCKCISEILGRIYQTQSRLEYYSKAEINENALAKTLWIKYCQESPSLVNLREFLDRVVEEVGMNDLQIRLLGDKIETFYRYRDEKAPVDEQCLSLITSEFKSLSKEYISVKRNGATEIIIPLREQRQLVGYIKYSYAQVNAQQMVNVFRTFVNSLILRMRNYESLLKGVSTNRSITPQSTQKLDSIHRWNQVLTAETFDQIQGAVRDTLSQFSDHLYGCIVWKYKSVHFVTSSENSLRFITNELAQSLLSSETELFQSVHPFSSNQSVFMRSFPCYKNNKLYQYQNDTKNMVVHQLRFDHFSILVGYLEHTITPKEATYASSIEPKIPYDDLMELAKNISTRTKKGFINEDVESSPIELASESLLIQKMTKSNEPMQIGRPCIVSEQNRVTSCIDEMFELSSREKRLAHGRYLRYQSTAMNRELIGRVKAIRDQGKGEWVSRPQQLQQVLQNAFDASRQTLKQTTLLLGKKIKLLQMNELLLEWQRYRLAGAVNQFKANKDKRQCKVSAMRRLVYGKASAKLILSQSFAPFKNEWILYHSVLQRNQQNGCNLVQKLSHTYVRAVFERIKCEARRKQRLKQAAASKLSEIIKSKTAAQKSNKIQSILLLYQRSKSRQYTKYVSTVSHLVSLSQLISNKVLAHYRPFFVSMDLQLQEFSNSISTIIEEISLVRMNSYKNLLSFVESRLQLHLRRLLNNQSAEISLKISKFKPVDVVENSDYSSVKNQPNIMVINFQGQQYITVVVYNLPMANYLTTNLSLLIVAVKSALDYIRENIRRKLVLFYKILSAFASSNLRQGLTSLHSHLASCYKNDLTRSYSMAKQSEEKLISQSLSQTLNKQNTHIHNQIKSLRQKTVQNNASIQTLKLQNKIRRKTLAASFIQLRDLELQNERRRKEEAFIKISIDSDVKFRQQMLEMDAKLRNRGVRMIGKLARDKNKQHVKQSFNTMINNLFND